MVSYGRQRSEVRLANSRPVATQFMADPKPRGAAHHDDARITDTFSPSFQRLRSVAAMKHGGRLLAAGAAEPVDGLKENCVIEHERFGVGTVVRLEGTGENLKATVQFKNAGTKQLLVKFARFKVIG